MNRPEINRKKRGIALMWALVVLLVLAIGAAAFIRLTNFDLAMSRRTAEATRTFYTAQAGIEKALAEIKVLFAHGKGTSAEDLALISPPVYDSFNFTTFLVKVVGEISVGTLEAGTYKGLNGVTQDLRIVSKVKSEKYPDVVTRLRQDLETQLIPIFQFAIFYNNDLEIQPGPPMTVIGPVHSNGDLYLGSNNSLNFDSIVTSTGKIYHKRKEGKVSGGGTVRVKDQAGNYQDMANDDGTWLDSEHENWVVESQTRWDGMVKSSAHQVNTLLLPLTSPEDPRALIERPDPGDSDELKDAKYSYLADLKIIDGWSSDKAGIPVNLNYQDPDNPSRTLNPVSKKEFYNYREGKTVVVTEIDVGKLIDSDKFPANGILYVSDERSASHKQDAVRLVNGTKLPSQGLTVVTDRPLYIQGDFNTVNKRPASVMCDAINILSNNWNDNNSSKSLNNRVATATEVNVAIIAGNTETKPGAYNGGVENFPRFLEKWSGKTLTYRGSLVAMWESQIATGQWIYGNPYYTAPNRNWSYDTDLSDPANAPPGMPSLYTIETTLWRGD